MCKIEEVKAREILDSRGNPTIEVEVKARKGFGRASVPSGASVGKRESLEKRNGEKRYGGKGVLKAVNTVNSEIRKEITGMDVFKQVEIDKRLIELDATNNKSRLGANAILATSIAVCKAAASSLKKSLYEYISAEVEAPAPAPTITGYTLPIPMMNVINGGKHAGNELSIQEILIFPLSDSFKEALRMGVGVYHSLRKVIEKKYGKIAINVGDEGGYAPPMSKTDEPLDTITEATSEAGYSEKEICMGIDAAASNFYEVKKEKYIIDGEEKDGYEMIDFYTALLEKYPLILIEDPFEEDSFELFAELTKVASRNRTIIVGDDLFVTNVEIIKAGAPARGERTAKYNQLLRIEEEIKEKT